MSDFSTGRTVWLHCLWRSFPASVTDIIWEKWYKCGKTFSNSSSGFTLMSSRFTLTLNRRLKQRSLVTHIQRCRADKCHPEVLNIVTSVVLSSCLHVASVVGPHRSVVWISWLTVCRWSSACLICSACHTEACCSVHVCRTSSWCCSSSSSSSR